MLSRMWAKREVKITLKVCDRETLSGLMGQGNLPQGGSFLDRDLGENRLSATFSNGPGFAANNRRGNPLSRILSVPLRQLSFSQ